MAAIGEKTAFVFSGGGSLGAIQIGMLRVLLSYGLRPDFVVGASVGAINAAYSGRHRPRGFPWRFSGKISAHHKRK